MRVGIQTSKDVNKHGKFWNADESGGSHGGKRVSHLVLGHGRMHARKKDRLVSWGPERETALRTNIGDADGDGPSGDGHGGGLH